jgi:hypothetical protein
MAVNGVGGGGGAGAVADLMKILQASQAQSIDLAKKLIQVGMQAAVTPLPEEGKGQNIDILA